MPTRPIRLVLAVAAMFALAACGSGSPGSREPRATTRPSGAAPTTTAFVSVAVDNHFHDIHPTDQRRIAESQTFVVKNQGRNLHNVTVAGTDISEDLEPGESLTWSPIGEVLKPGKYSIVCKYHDWDGMTGTFTVVP